ncbi:hypothetical protein Tco_0135608, partial [Tanacetum coccineum]
VPGAAVEPPRPDATSVGSSEDADVAEVDSGLKRKRATGDVDTPFVEWPWERALAYEFDDRGHPRRILLFYHRGYRHLRDGFVLQDFDQHLL